MGTTAEEIQADYEKSKTYANPHLIPKYSQNIDITPTIKTLNIEPYSSKPMYTATLPNNSIFNAINSRTDNCNIFWTLYAPDNKSENLAAKYVLGEMISMPSALQQYIRAKNNNSLSVTLDIPNQFVFTASAPSDGIKDAIKTVKCVTDIDFSQGAFEDAKKRAYSIIDFNKEKAFDMYKKQRHGNKHNMNPEEIKKQLEKLTINDVREYYNQIMQNAYSTISVSAPFDKNPNLINEIASAFNTPNYSFKPVDSGLFKDNYTKKTGSTCFIKEQRSEQPEFQSVYNFKISGNPNDEMKFELLAKILKRRLYDDLREKQGLAYIVTAMYENSGNDGRMVLDLSSSCDDKDIPRIYEGFKQNAQNLAMGNITQKELDEAKSSYKRSVYSLLDSPSDTLIMLDNLSSMPYGVYSMQNTFDTLDKITVDDIKQAAKYVFSEAPDYLADCSANTINQNLEYFKTLGNIQK